MLIRESATHYSWDRGEDFNFGPYFSTNEFTCHCGICDPQSISKTLLDALGCLRSDFGGAIRVVSGYRCEKYQDSLKAKGYETALNVSRHVHPADAVDIQPVDMSKFDLLKDLCLKRFSGVGVARRFIHVDCRTKQAYWTYKTL